MHIILVKKKQSVKQRDRPISGPILSDPVIRPYPVNTRSRIFLFSLNEILQVKKRILGECLLISSLPGTALRMLVDIARLAERFNMHSQS